MPSDMESDDSYRGPSDRPVVIPGTQIAVSQVVAALFAAGALLVLLYQWKNGNIKSVEKTAPTEKFCGQFYFLIFCGQSIRMETVVVKWWIVGKKDHKVSQPIIRWSAPDLGNGR